MGWSAGPTNEHAAAGAARDTCVARHAAWLVVVLALACEAQDLSRLGTQRYESERFEVWASDGLEACGGTYAYMEQWLAAFRERVGEHGNPGRHAFYWLTPEEFTPELCTTGIACTYPQANVVYSTLIPFEHEIVHAELDAQPPSVLGEGAAEAFGSIDSPFSTSIMHVGPLLDAERIPGEGYQTAGRFSRFLIERYGLDGYFALYEALDGARGSEAFAEAAEETLGVEASELVKRFDEARPCSVEQWRYFDYECSALPVTAWRSPTRWAEELDLACASEDVIGPRRGLVWTLRALEVEHAGWYELGIESADESAQVAILPCGGNCYGGEPSSVARVASVAAGGRATVFLMPGRHWMRVDCSDRSEAAVSVTLER